MELSYCFEIIKARLLTHFLLFTCTEKGSTCWWEAWACQDSSAQHDHCARDDRQHNWSVQREKHSTRLRSSLRWLGTTLLNSPSVTSPSSTEGRVSVLPTPPGSSLSSEGSQGMLVFAPKLSGPAAICYWIRLCYLAFGALSEELWTPMNYSSF